MTRRAEITRFRAARRVMTRAEEAKLRSLSSRNTAAGKIGPLIGQRLSVKNEKYFAIF